MPMKIEAAAVTQKRPAAEFNNDSVNINGKVFSREIIRNGYKGSGIVSGDVYFALASSGVDGFADAAVAAFNENAASFGSQLPEAVLGEFFDNCAEALSRTSHSSDALVCANLYAGGRKVVIAFNGNAAAYKFNGETCVRVSATSVSESGVSTCVFPDVAAGEIYILVSPGVTATLSDKDIEDICKVSDGSVKRIVNLISKVSLSKEGTDAGSAIAVNILETALDDENVAPVVLPDFSDVAPENKDVLDESVAVDNDSEENDSDMKIVGATAPVEIKDSYTEMIDEFEEADAASHNAEDDSVEDEEEETISGKKGKILIAVGAVIALIVVCLVVVFVVKGFSGQEETTVDETTTVEETTEEETTEEESTTEEETTEEETTEEETTEAETTTRRQTPVVVPTTQAPTTQAPTTEAPTTEAPTTEAPTTEAPPTAEPSTEAPSETSTTQAPATETPSEETPSEETPATEASEA